MDLVLCGLSYQTRMVYLHDIIVFAPNFDGRLDRLEEIFQRLWLANLKLYPDKCSLLQRRVAFFGHLVSETEIEIQAEKTDAVKDWPVPCNLKEVRSFVSFCSYYRRFVAGFADIAAPLHALTRKNAKFEWSSERQQAFDALKQKLTTAPVLGRVTDVSRSITFPDRRFPDKTFPGKTLPGQLRALTRPLFRVQTFPGQFV